MQAAFAPQHGLAVVCSTAEVRSGLNGQRPKLLPLLGDAQIRVLAVEHRDRLARFSAEYIEAALVASGRRLVIVDPSEVTDDLVQDMIDVMTGFCARLYGRRAARNRATKGAAAAMADTAC